MDNHQERGAIVGLERKVILKHIPEYHIRFTILSQ
jgi:hypothetical protein